MKENLLEISGIVVQGYTDSLLAVNDEQARLFNFGMKDKKAGFVRFGKQGDYEDVALYRDRIFILRSDGTLFSFPADSIYTKMVTPQRWEAMLPKGEYESMYAHEADSKLYVLCKECKKEKKFIQAYELSLQEDSITHVRDFTIDTEELCEKRGMKWGFRASAMAWNEATREWYIISSVNKLLMVTDAAWKTKDIYELNPKNFIQPEGMAFDAKQNLYVSNEGNETRNGNVLKFTFQAKK